MLAQESNSELGVRFSSALPVTVIIRPVEHTNPDWQEFDRGPGYFHIPAGHQIGIKIKGIDNRVLKSLVAELQPVKELYALDLAENRNITDDGLVHLAQLDQLVTLNLSSCSITSTGFAILKQLIHLERLNLSFCNRLTDQIFKTVEGMRSLVYLDLQGCPGITKGGVSRVRKRNLEIYR